MQHQRKKKANKVLWLPPAFREEWEQLLADHKEALAGMEITDISRLIRWAATLGKPKAETILKAIEDTKKEE